jgi:hypothetical protein
MKTYLDESFEKELKKLRIYESESFERWGSRKRIFKMLGVDFEIKFCRAESMLKDALYKGHVKEKVKMVEMMIRAFDSLNIECEKSGYNRIQPSTRCFNFDKKTAIICDTDDEKPVLYKVHKDEPDIMIFSIEELLRCIPQDFMKAKELLSKIDKAVNFQRISYKGFEEEKHVEIVKIDEKSYKYQVDDNLHNYVKITLSDADINKVSEFADRCIPAKKIEKRHINDPISTRKRFMTGYTGELAVEKYLQKEFIDWSVGESIYYVGSDLSKLGLNIGVKTAQYGKYCLVPKKNKESQIIVIKAFNDKDFYICGVAKSNILNKYQCESLVHDDNARKKKSAFYGYRNLEPISKLKKWIENHD